MKNKILISLTLLYTFSLGYISLTKFYNTLSFTDAMFDRDNYLAHIESFHGIGFYDQIVFGTSIFFNSIIYAIDFIFDNLDVSFKIINILSAIALALIGGLLIYRNKSNNLWVNIFFVPLYGFFWFDNSELTWTNNDVFLSVLFLLIYYVIFTSIKVTRKAIIIGLLLGLAFSTRTHFSILLLPGLFYVLLTTKISNDIKPKLFFYFTALFLGVISLFHFPSLKEKGKLSSFVKGGDYPAINTIGTLRMFDEKKVQIIRKEIYFSSTGKSVIEKYKEKYEINTFPSNGIQFAFKYPFYYLKLLGLNIINVIVYLFRRFSLLLIFPVIHFSLGFRRNKFKVFVDKGLAPFYMFLISCFSLLFVLNTVIEFRWMDTFEFLMLFAIFNSFKFLSEKSKLPKTVFIIFCLSLISLTVFNFNTIFGFLSLWA